MVTDGTVKPFATLAASVRVATPLLTVPVPSVTEPILKVTEPVAAVVPKVAVKVSDWPIATGFVLATGVTVVVSPFTVSVCAVEVEVANVVSPE